jgi:geranylgeranyl pyrophosphate synthase
LLRDAERAARTLLEFVNRQLETSGHPCVEARGKLIRPAVALGGLAGQAPPAGFAEAVAAIQLAHEASLVHDDIIDGASIRRGLPSVVARRGVARALVHGDHLLTTSYVLAARTGSAPFMAAFANALERTVAGEMRQASATGRRIDREEQRDILIGKSGALFGCALASAALLRGDPASVPLRTLGLRIGLVYQRIDDLFDYLPEATTGKPALMDYRQRHWTWPLDLAPVMDFACDPDVVAERFRTPGADGRAPIAAALDQLRAEIAALRADLVTTLGATVLTALLDRWTESLASLTPAASARARPSAMA